MARVRGLVPFTVALVVALLAVGLLGFSSTLNPVDALLGRGAVVTVPDVVGAPQPRAVIEVEDVGLEARLTTAFSLTAPRGTVLGQTPRAGERLRQGESVELVVSKGANRIEMPDAVGEPVDRALVPFEEADIDVEVERTTSETVDEDVVMEQQPAPGVQVSGADRVVLVVSDGPAEREVPDIVGRSSDAASFELGRAGLEVGEFTLAVDPAVPFGAVVSSDPPPGTVVARNTAVAMVVSVGAAPVPVPDVVNDTEEAAVRALEAAGFQVALATRLVGVGGDGLGGVFEQYPDAGTEYRPGETVTIVVGRDQPPQLPPRTTTTTTTTTPERSTTSTTRRGGR